MKLPLIDSLDLRTMKRATPPRRRPSGGSRRSYAAADAGRLWKDWPTTGGTADRDLFMALAPMRVRSRHLAKNNDYAKRFFNMLRTNVVGPTGIRMQFVSKDDAGNLDKADNDYLEAEWKHFGKKGNCTVDGKLTMIDCQKLFIETVARDGEAIVRKHKGPWIQNKYKFALQFIEPDLLDHEKNLALPNNGSIRLGVEFDQWRRPVAYHLKRRTNADYLFSETSHYYDRHERVPANEIVHEFIMDRIGQSRGVPWVHTAARRLQMLNGYEEAELVASRTAAAKMGFFTSDGGEDYTGDDYDEEEGAEKKAPVMDASAGTFEELPQGWDFVKWDPDHPVAAYEAFVLAILRGAASGLNVSYVGLANDLRGVSFSSIRQGTQEERDHWRTLQGWMIEHFLTDIQESWLDAGLTLGGLMLPPRKFDKFNAVIWRPRGWQWVNPAQEGTAHEKAVKNGFQSPQDIAGAQGRDLEEIFEQIAAAKKLAEKYGLSIDILSGPPKQPGGTV